MCNKRFRGTLKILWLIYATKLPIKQQFVPKHQLIKLIVIYKMKRILWIFSHHWLISLSINSFKYLLFISQESPATSLFMSVRKTEYDYLENESRSRICSSVVNIWDQMKRNLPKTYSSIPNLDIHSLQLKDSDVIENILIENEEKHSRERIWLYDKPINKTERRSNDVGP